MEESLFIAIRNYATIKILFMTSKWFLMFHRQLLPNLNLLRVFEAAGRHCSFKLASEELFVTPSAVSQQVKTLEKQLDVILFIRNNRSLELTVIGKSYWQKIQKHIEGIYLTTLELVQTEQTGLTISIMPAIANRIVLPKLHIFHQSHANIDLRIDVSSQYVDILKGVADVAIRFGSPPWEGLEHVKLSEIDLQVVCPLGFTALYQLDKNPNNILNAPLIHMSKRPDAWARWFQSENRNSFQGKQHVLDDYPSAIQAAEFLGATIALMPLEKELIQSHRLETPFPAVGPILEAIYVVYQPDNIKIESIRSFTQWIKSEVVKFSTK